MEAEHLLLLQPQRKSPNRRTGRTRRNHRIPASGFLEEYNIPWLRLLPAIGVSILLLVNITVTILAVSLGHTTFAFDAGEGEIHLYTIHTPPVSLCHNHSPEMFLFPIGSVICMACILGSWPLLFRLLLGSLVVKKSEATKTHYFICYLTLGLGGAAFFFLIIASCVPLEKNALFIVTGPFSGGVSWADLLVFDDPSFQTQFQLYSAVCYFILSYCHCTLVLLVLMSKHVHLRRTARFRVSSASLMVKFVCLVMQFLPSNYFFLMFWRPTNIPSCLKADTFRAQMNASGLMQRFIIAHHMTYFASFSADFYWLKEFDDY